MQLITLLFEALTLGFELARWNVEREIEIGSRTDRAGFRDLADCKRDAGETLHGAEIDGSRDAAFERQFGIEIEIGANAARGGYDALEQTDAVESFNKQLALLRQRLLSQPAAFRDMFIADGANALLNYGYTILRAATARAIVAAGLHPGLGIFHRHPHNAMPLADDLMEPFRPLVDLLVCTLLQNGVTDVTPAAKHHLASVLQQDQATAAGTTPVSTCMQRLAASLAESYLQQTPALEFPLLELTAETGPADDGQT